MLSLLGQEATTPYDNWLITDAFKSSLGIDKGIFEINNTYLGRCFLYMLPVYA